MAKHSHNFEDLTGRRFGRWTVREYAGRVDSVTRWICECDCGARLMVRALNLKTGGSRSCGCLRVDVSKETNWKHGHSSWRRGPTSEYRIYHKMLRRCFKETDPKYHRYGGRGITVCDRWRGPEGFINFFADMGSRPGLGYSIDRIDNDGNYEPGNCRWATVLQQARNKSTVTMVEWKGKRISLPDACDEEGLSLDTVYNRIKYLGWEVERALSVR